MAQPKLPDAVLKATIDALASHRTRQEAAESLGLGLPTFVSRLSRALAWAKKSGYQSKATPPPIGQDSFTAHGDTAQVQKLTKHRVRTLADLVAVCQIDTDEWVIDRWQCGAYEGQSKDTKTSVVTVTPMFSVRAWLRRNRPIIETKAEIKALFEDAAKRLPAAPFVKRAAKGDYMLELMIPDLHLGKLAWAPETGYQNYDSKIAGAVFREAVEVLVARTASLAFGRVVFPVGNDLFHSDTKQGTTTKGTPLDNDGRFQKMYSTGRRMIVEAIERLRQIAPVEVVMVPGNHDAVANFCLGDSLECWFRNTKDVMVRNSPSPRKYVQHGQNMILFSHGDLGKRADWPLLMATEQPEMFGATRHRETHTGHTHKTQVDEKMGVRVRTFSALCAADSWHSENLFVGNARQADALVWHPREGIVSSATYTVMS